MNSPVWRQKTFRARRWAGIWQRAESVIMVSIIVVTVVWFFAVPIVSRLQMDEDARGQPLQQALGTVESITYLPGTETSPNREPTFHIRVADQMIDHPCLLNVRPGQRLTVKYRRGKSGTIYISSLSL